MAEFFEDTTITRRPAINRINAEEGAMPTSQP